MELRINEAASNEIYESKQYTRTREEGTSSFENQAENSGVVYEHGTEQDSQSCVYTKDQIMGTNASAENKQFQNNLKTLGFYSASATTDGNLGSAESIRAIKNFQRVYGIPENGGSNEETRAKLKEVMTFYNNTLQDPDLKTVAQLKNGYSDYNEAIVKSDVARVWTFLRVGMGVTAKQAAGIMGNIMKESGASPTNANDDQMGSKKLRDTTYVYSATDDIAYGIIQWRGSRKQGLLKMANDMERSVSDCNVQFAYLRSELESTYKNKWKEVTDAADIETAARAFCRGIEVTGWGDERLTFANTVYNALA